MARTSSFQKGSGPDRSTGQQRRQLSALSCNVLTRLQMPTGFLAPARHWVMKGLLFHYPPLWSIGSSLHSVYGSNFALSDASRWIGPILPTPSFPAPTCELGKENHSHISYHSIYWRGVISPITDILTREWVPGKRETQPSSLSLDIACGVTLSPRPCWCLTNTGQLWPSFQMATMPRGQETPPGN